MRYLAVFFMMTQCFALSDISSPLSDYFSLVQTSPIVKADRGNARRGEIEILSDPKEIIQAQKEMKERLIANGYSEEEAKKFSKVGIVAEDAYYIFLRDAVRFPSGHLGTFDRVLPRSDGEGPSGVVTLALSPENKIVTILNYRHALRSWTIELPRGRREVYESPMQAAERELREETGYLAQESRHIGKIAPDSGILSTQNYIYFVKTQALAQSEHDVSEAINSCHLFTPEELKRALTKGEMELEIHGKRQRVLVVDSFIAHALLLAETLSLL